NPWLGEIYINDSGHPIGALAHEMTHAISGEFGIPFFGYSMALPVSADGMIEGIAVAASFHDHGTGTPDEQSAAMLAEGLLPRPEHFLDLFGFRGDLADRAYTASGSFVHWLVATYGPDKFRAAYPWCRFRSVYGKELH